MLITPLGNPAFSIFLANSNTLLGDKSLGFKTIVLPVTKAGAALRAIRKNGKFHGKIPAITPIGSL
jgi:hypothetical protein